MKFYIIDEEKLKGIDLLLKSKVDGKFVSLERSKNHVSHSFEDIAQYDARWDTVRIITVQSSQLDESKRLAI